ncbi:hypothetical protein, partial [Amycolatopsis sp.]|uniref:hypothetical protein n=1 Tax=Amycolatopsis sp. TaxID=37632 RepID=UPI002C33B4D8
SDPSGLIIQIDGHPAWKAGDAAYNAAVSSNWANSFANNPNATVNRANGSTYHTKAYWSDVARGRIPASRAFANPQQQLLDDILAPPEHLANFSPLAFQCRRAGGSR